ncbi:type II toxin-antitoxin system RelE/ParE family toxin [Aliihoeflea aestuarii]|jgi:toxin ParE1/3/4|uniref:type II toxin-antitoxin system RelE/ParE family toxin n=1 Tax=Aliihoeflea aestuarii TaxID=453840 RepID=UPI002095C27F|nr:type II toxin-antitoxin system RelE/ParE family toxin [Aliihoeflea aestuarii]MCO6392743.1 type II toxin-antitoxin system RelE/ParE family toxin [Aliihoeflea aestuarii]
MRIVRTPAAETDLIDIWIYIAADNIPAADRLLDAIGNRIEQLKSHPFSGAARPDIAPDARLLPIGNYVVLYRVRADAVEIVRVVHGARDASALF